MKTFLSSSFLAISGLLLFWSMNGTPPAQVGKTVVTAPIAKTSTETVPVLLELFTSQGCSSCPPADRVLTELADEDAVIALSYHVDYWNRLGWTDPYSQAKFSQRQRDYAQHLKDGRVYTPQAVVQGQRGLVGSREGDVRRTVSEYQRQALSVDIAGSVAVTDERVTVEYRLEGPLAQVDLYAALVSPQVGNEVPRGENRGRHLSHSRVVRALEQVKNPAAAGTLIFEDLPMGELEVVVFVQDREDWRVSGVKAF